MIPLALALYLCCHLGLLAWSLRREGAWGRGSPRLWFLRLLLVGMAYDNAILLLGDVGVGADWYRWLNVPRYVLHAGLLPFLTIFALSTLQVGGVRAARQRGVIALCWILTGVALVYGLWHEVFLLRLEPSEVAGHTRLVSARRSPPYATIATNLLILPMALALWRRAGVPHFFLGSLLIFLLNGGAAGQPWGFVAGNGVEVVFIACLLTTERELVSRAESESEDRAIDGRVGGSELGVEHEEHPEPS